MFVGSAAEADIEIVLQVNSNECSGIWRWANGDQVLCFANFWGEAPADQPERALCALISTHCKVCTRVGLGMACFRHRLTHPTITRRLRRHRAASMLLLSFLVSPLFSLLGTRSLDCK